jgi:hypothetical protein
VGKAERRAAQELVAGYHEAQLTELFEHVSTAVNRYRSGEIDIYSMDEIIHHYHRAAQELWKFCWSVGHGSNVQFVASVIERMAADGEEPIDWWERGAPRSRQPR